MTPKFWLEIHRMISDFQSKVKKLRECVYSILNHEKCADFYTVLLLKPQILYMQTNTFER